MSRVKMTLVGDPETGKTSWLSVMKGGEMTTMADGCLEPFTKKIRINQTDYEMEICDTAGHENKADERYRTYRDTDVFLICFAENDTVSFKNVVARWYPEVKSYRPNASCALICTKIDLRSKRIPTEEIDKVKKRCNFCYAGSCSAYSAFNLEEIFTEIITNLCEVPVPKKSFYHKLFVRCCNQEND